MTPQAAQIIVTAAANPSWEWEKLLGLSSPAGVTTIHHLFEARATKLLLQDADGLWVVKDDAVKAVVKQHPNLVLCACNNALIPYDGTTAGSTSTDMGNPEWTSEDGVTHIFDGVCGG